MDGRGRRRAGAALTPTRQEVRAAARRRRARRGQLISAGSTLLVFGVLAYLITNASGWPEVKSAFFDWHDFKDAFPDVLKGFWLDVKIFCVVEFCVLILALVVALSRTTRSPALYPLRLIGAVFTDVTRGVPTALWVYLIGFGVPALSLQGLPTDPVVLGGIALTLAYSGYVAEVYRSGIESVHPSQQAGALALGLTRWQALRHVVLPQAIRRVAPPLLNDFIALQKDAALVSFIGPLEAFRVGQIEAAQNFVYTPLVAAAVLYLCVTIPMARFVDHLQKRNRAIRGQVEVAA